MAKDRKRAIREAFNTAVFQRDGGKCVLCGAPGVDAHHITDRHELPNGGYVPENGITVCEACHLDCEQFHLTGEALPGRHPDDLYRLIGSSREEAFSASERLE
jgi:5-methylcytosine-specific restriction endonuclease McrA